MIGYGCISTSAAPAFLPQQNCPPGCDRCRHRSAIRLHEIPLRDSRPGGAHSQSARPVARVCYRQSSQRFLVFCSRANNLRHYRDVCPLADHGNIKYLRNVTVRVRHILLGFAVAAFVLGAYAGSVHNPRTYRITFSSQRLTTAANPRPTDSKPVWTGRKPIVSLTREEFHSETPLLQDQLPHFQEFKTLPRPSCTLLPVRCVYIRYWPRDPPSA